MDKAVFSNILSRFNRLSLDEAEAILDAEKAYPYSQILHVLAARASRDHQMQSKDKHLHLSAIYATNRIVLKEVMTAPGLAKIKNIVPKGTHVEEAEIPAKENSKETPSSTSLEVVSDTVEAPSPPTDHTTAGEVPPVDAGAVEIPEDETIDQTDVSDKDATQKQPASHIDVSDKEATENETTSDAEIAEQPDDKEAVTSTAERAAVDTVSNVKTSSEIEEVEPLDADKPSDTDEGTKLSVIKGEKQSVEPDLVESPAPTPEEEAAPPFNEAISMTSDKPLVKGLFKVEKSEPVEKTPEVPTTDTSEHADEGTENHSSTDKEMSDQDEGSLESDEEAPAPSPITEDTEKAKDPAITYEQVKEDLDQMHQSMQRYEAVAFSHKNKTTKEPEAASEAEVKNEMAEPVVAAQPQAPAATPPHEPETTETPSEEKPASRDVTEDDQIPAPTSPPPEPASPETPKKQEITSSTDDTDGKKTGQPDADVQAHRIKKKGSRKKSSAAESPEKPSVKVKAEEKEKTKPKRTRSPYSGDDTLLKDIEKTKKEKAPINKEQTDIIDKFIEKHPAPPKNKPMDYVSNIPKGSLSNVLRKDIASETLVNILVKQGKTSKAIEVLKKLIWKYPQKKTYFASRIKQLIQT